jgi:tRNA threonylcarbamoyl adenosine modification protein (Sua5/YciO/YrdC/YwlC family)
VIYRCQDLDKILRLVGEEFAVLPADTLYSLSIGINSPKAYRIYEIKGRGRDTPVPVGVLDKKMLQEYGEVNSFVSRIISYEWHYLVTMVLWNRNVPRSISGEKVGFRIPKTNVLKKIMENVGPITLTSANRHGGKNPVTVLDAYSQLGDDVKIYLDCGPCTGVPSTVVDLTGEKPILIREGAVPFKSIEAIL